MKKYSPIGELSLFSQQYADALAQASGHVVCITDRDQIIALSGAPKKDFLGKEITAQLDKTIEEREVVMASCDEKKYIKVTENADAFYYETINPIISEGDAIGSVCLLGKDKSKKMGEVEQKLAMSAAGFLGRQIEQ